jgi:hypothetical protein
VLTHATFSRRELISIYIIYGILFLKCFSDKEPRQEGPYKFSPDGIRDLFSESFRIDSIKETVYQGTLDPFPRALFVVMVKQ